MLQKLCTALLLLHLGACSPELPDASSRLSAGGTRIGHYKGVDAVTSHMRSLLFDPQDAPAFSFRQLVDGRALGADRLSNLLGSFSSGTGEETMQNDSPNGLNLMLWKLNLQKFAGLLAAVCDTPGEAFIKIEGKTLRLHPRYLPLLLAACEADAAELPDAAEGLWLGTMGWDAPDQELIAWRAYVATEAEAFSSLPAPERVQQLLLAIFFNPFFLLES